MAEVVRGAGARCVADLGCGAGALLAFLAAAGEQGAAGRGGAPRRDGEDRGAAGAGDPPPPAAADGVRGGGAAGPGWALRRLIGVDISGTALVRAQKTLQVQAPPAGSLVPLRPMPYVHPAKEVQLCSRAWPPAHTMQALGGQVVMGAGGAPSGPPAVLPVSAGVRGGPQCRRRSRQVLGGGAPVLRRPSSRTTSATPPQARPLRRPAVTTHLLARCASRPSEDKDGEQRAEGSRRLESAGGGSRSRRWACSAVGTDAAFSVARRA